MIQRLFLSHADADSQLAHLLHDEIKKSRPELPIFVSSMAGAIPTGSEWLAEIKMQLSRADAYLILLTPVSIQRLWVWFESGAAFMSGRRVLGVCAHDLPKSSVPSPLSGHQLLSLDSAADSVQLFVDLGTELEAVEGFMKRVGAARRADQKKSADQAGWVGVEVEGGQYVWHGPLADLVDRDAVVAKPSLVQAIRDAGMSPGFANIDRKLHHLSRGRLQVFRTDRRSWKRPVVNDGNQILLVHAEPSTESAQDVARLLRDQQSEHERRSKKLTGPVGVDAARQESQRLFEEIRQVATSLSELPLSVESHSDGVVLRYGVAGRTVVEWVARWTNTLDDAALIVTEWQSRHQPRSVSIPEEPLTRVDFQFDLLPSGEYGWRQDGDEPEWFSTPRLADWCVRRVLKRAMARC